MTLDEQRALVRVDAAGEKRGSQLASLASEFFWILFDGDGVKIDDAKEVLLLVLSVNPAFEGTDIVAQLWIAGGLNSAENPFAGARFWLIRLCICTGLHVLIILGQ
jgi:hypothetical protein